MAHPNMMQNGMPGQGQVNGMQRPQPGNIHDQVSAQIMHSLHSELPKFHGLWQGTVPLGARLTRVMQLFTQLKFLEGDMTKCLRTALQFEHETISRTPDQNTYNQAMMRKLAEISTKRNQNLGGQFPNGGQMQPNQQPGNHAMNPAQMNQRVQQQQQNMGMPPQQMPNNGMNQLSAPGMQQSLSQNAHQQQPHMNTTPNPQQAAMQQQQQPHMQEIQETARRMMATLTDEKKAQLRNGIMRNMTEQQRQESSATKKDPLIGFVFQKATQQVIGRRQSAQAAGGQQQQNMQMSNAGGVSMSQSASQQGSNFDFTAIMGQQANALKLQESGNEVVPASNNPNNPFNGQMNAPNQGGINPAMLGNGNGPGGPQMQPNMAQQQQLQFVAMQREKQRQEQMRNNANNAARAQALQQAQLHGQNMGPQNALNGAAGGSPAMTMLNRPMQPPGSQAPNTPQQPNRTPNMQQPNQQQQGQTPANGTNALMQHHQSMVNRNNSGVNMQALLASLPPHPILQMEAAQQLIRSMPPQIFEKLRSTPVEAFPAFIKQWAATRQRQQGQNPGMPMGGQQGGINAMPNGMPDVNMQQSMLPQGQGQAPPGLDPAMLQARMQQQQQQRQLLLQNQQVQNQQLHQQQPHPQQPNPLQHLPPNFMDQLPQNVKQQAMLIRPFPPQIPQALGIAVPPGMRFWGHLKNHIDRNSNAMPPNTSLRFSQTISKWFHDHPEELQNGVKQVIMQRQAAQQGQQQTQVQNQGQPGNNNLMGMPNGSHGAAPTAQMMQPTPSMQPGAGGPPTGPGQGQLRMPPQTPVGAQEVSQFRQRIPDAHAMTDDQIRGVIAQSRQKGITDQNNALKQAQMQNTLPQNAAGGNQQPRMNRTPGQVATEQMAGPQPGQKRAQPTSSANDDVMEIPNPNALQPPPANKARPTGPLAGMKLPNLTPEQLEKLDPEQREQVMKRYESLRQANAGARPTQAVPAAPQVPGGSRPNEQKNVAKPDPDNVVMRPYQEVNTKKGPPVQQDAKAVQEIIPILRKIFIAYQQIDKVFSNALRLPEFSEERIKKLMEAKIMVFHNWDPALDCAKGALSINLQQAKYAQGLLAEFLRDLQQAKARGQWNQNQAQQAANQSQQQQPATAATKQPVVQAPSMEKSGSKHGRKSSSSKVPAAPIDNRTFDWSQGVSSPHGIPKYESGSTQLTPDKLQLPPNKRRRTGQPESAEGTPVGQAATPSGTSPGVGGAKSNSPEQLRKAQIQAKLEADARDKKRWKCTKDAACEASITGFESEEELKGHFESVHKEIEDPLQFLLDSAAETLGVDLDGKPLPGKTADKPKAGSRLLPPKATAMKREASNTPGVKHEARTPAGQVATPATPGSANKGAAKAGIKQGVAANDPNKPTNLHDTVSAKMGYPPVAVADDATTASALANDQLWAEISSTVASGLATFEPLTFDGFAGAHIDDWGLRPDDGTGLPSSPETTPESSNTSLNSDISSNDRLRMNLEWDAFGNGDTAVPEMLNAAVDGLGIGGGPELKFFEDEKMTGVDQPAKPADDKKKSDDPLGDPFEWSANADVSWESIFGDQGNAEPQFDFTSGNQDGMQMQFEF